MALAADFSEVVESLSDDWTDLELDLRIADEGRYVDAAVMLSSSGKGSRRALCRPCLDWSERRIHLGGALGAAICRLSFDQGWIRRVAGSRAVTVTPAGHHAYRERFGAQL